MLSAICLILNSGHFKNLFALLSPVVKVYKSKAVNLACFRSETNIMPYYWSFVKNCFSPFIFVFIYNNIGVFYLNTYVFALLIAELFYGFAQNQLCECLQGKVGRLDGS